MLASLARWPLWLLGLVGWWTRAEHGRLHTRAGDRSVTVNWECGNIRAPGFDVERRVLPSGAATVVARDLQAPSWADVTATNGIHYAYRMRAPDGRESPWAGASPRAFADDKDFLGLVAGAAFDYFRFEANPLNGLVRDRTTRDSKCSIAATGFALSAYCCGVERGWWTRTEAAERARATLRTFARSPPDTASADGIGHRGWFYHFLEMDSATRAWKCELSSIDTALLLGGVLDARAFFGGDPAAETEVRELAERILARVDWEWMLDGGDTFRMGWHPETGFIARRWEGYNEAMILPLLALGAVPPPRAPSLWESWCRTYRWGRHHGLEFVEFAPLFGHQYSHCWIDFRGVADAYMRPRGIDYFENSRRATLAQRAYAAANPGKFAGYGPDSWGFTASDTPDGYMAYGAPPAENDRGNIAPTAPGGSLPFAPAECTAALRALYDRHRRGIWGPYGFRDALNPSRDWYATDTLGIDQGAMLLMIENARGAGPWARLKGDARFGRGLERAGFRPLGR